MLHPPAHSTRFCCSPIDWDVVVVGAGPAGAAAARQLARAGQCVLLVDEKPFPRSKVCGCCLNGQALETLHSTGLGGLVERLDAVPLRTIRLQSAAAGVDLPLPVGAALSRTRFDAALIEAAVAAGVQFRPQTRAVVGPADAHARTVHLQSRLEVNRQRESNEAGGVSARVVLAAGGLSPSGLAGHRRLCSRPASGARVGGGCLLRDFPDWYRPGTVFMAVGRCGYVGLVQLEDGGLNVAGAFDLPFVQHSGGPGPAAAAILEQTGFPAPAGLTRTDWSGTPALTRRPERLADRRLFLLGDAAGYAEPFTGEGIGWALASAAAVVPLVGRGVIDWQPELEYEWTAVHRRLIRNRQRTCRLLAAGLRSPRLVDAALRFLSHVPATARPLVNRLVLG